MMTQQDLVRELMQSRDLLFGFVYAIVRDHAAAEEIFQEVALAIVVESNKGTEVEAFLPWARQIARSRIREYFSKRSKALPGALPEFMVPTVCQVFEENEPSPAMMGAREKYLLECLDHLSGRVREALKQRYLGGAPLQAIASGLAWKVASLKVALSRAKRVLFDCVQSKLRAQAGVH